MIKKCLASLLVLVLMLTPGIAPANGEMEAGYSNQTLIIDNADIYAMAALDGVLYLLQSDGLYVLPPGAKDATLLQAYTEDGVDAQGYGYGTLIASEEALYGFSASDMTLYKLDVVSGSVEKETVLEPPGFNEPIIRHAFIDDTRLVCLIEGTICQFDIDSGALSTLKAAGIDALAGYQDGLFIAIEGKRDGWYLNYHLITLDPKTGERATLAELGTGSFGWASLAFNPATQTAYIAEYGKIFAWHEATGIETAATFARGDAGNIVLINDDYAAIEIDFQLLAIRALNPDAAILQKQLVIQDPIGRSEEYKAFIKAHSDVDLAFHQKDSMGNEARYLQDMITGADDIDVYLLSNPNLIGTIKQKAYAVDLSPNAVIKQSLNDMYAPFQDAFTEGEHIYIIPKQVFLLMPCYNEAAFNALGLDKPTTYAEFFDFCLMWLEQMADDHPEYRLDPFMFDLDLTSLLKRYADEMSMNGQALSYQSETMQAVVEKYMAVQSAYETYDCDGEATHLFYWLGVPFKGNFEYLPLTFEKDNTFVFDIGQDEIRYFVVNPYSKNQEEAIAFLECYLENMDTVYSIVLSKKFANAVANDAFEAQAKEVEDAIADLEARNKVAEPADRRDIESMINEQKAYLMRLKESDEWFVSQGDIDTYLQYADNVYFNPFNPILRLLEDDAAFETRFANSQADTASFLALLDARIAMMLSEQK